MTRVAILVDERDQIMGKTTIPDAAMVIRHGDDMFVRTTEGRRLVRGGTGVGVIFRVTEVFERPKLTK